MRYLLAMALTAGLPVVAQTADGGVRLSYRATGPQAPMREAFDVTSTLVAWRDDQGRVRMTFDRRASVLTTHGADAADPAGDVRLDADGIATLVDQLRSASADMERQAAQGSAAQQALARQRWQQLLAPRGPWSALDRVRAQDARPLLGSDATVLGYRCSRIALHADGQAIGEACVAPATSVSGGAAVLQMLQAMAAVLDRLREWPDTPVYLAWPSHPLVAAARSGQLPLQVIQHAPGGVRHQLQLDAVQPLPSIPVSGP
mgnify:CR=1 FL=1